MWFTPAVFETLRNGIRDVYDIMCNEKPDDSENGSLQGSENELFLREDDENPPERVSNLQTFWNLFNANQGVVILSMPYVVLSGTYLSLLFTALIALMSNYTSKILIKCLYETDPESGIEVRVRSSYEDIGEAFGGSAGKWLVYAAMIVEQLSYCTLLLILCGSILHSSFPHLPFTKEHWSMLAFVLVIPNAFMMNLGQVAFVSLLTVVIGQVVYITVAVYSFYKSDDWSMNTPEWDIGKFFVSMGIVVVSYSSQPYMPAIEGSMIKKRHFGIVSDVTYVAITLVKIVFGLIGYFTFKGDTKQVITNNLPHGPFKITINICVLMLALFSFTFPAYTVFLLIDKVRIDKEWVGRKMKTFNLPKTRPKGMESEDDILQKTTLLEDESNGDDDEDEDEVKEKKDEKLKPMSRLKRAFIRLLLISVALTIAVIVPHFGLYMSFVGNFTGMCLAFIFPCLFHLKLKHLVKGEMMTHTFIIIFGSVSAGVGMYYSTRALMDAYSQAD